jgi:hypothetical protein
MPRAYGWPTNKPSRCSKVSCSFFNVSGIDPKEDTKIVFAWCRNEDFDSEVLLGSGYVVGADGYRPPGLLVGQFSITFPLPAECLADNIVVTLDKNSKEPLSGVTLTRCVTQAVFQSAGRIIPDNPPMHTDAIDAASHFVNRGQIIMAHKTGLEP